MKRFTLMLALLGCSSTMAFAQGWSPAQLDQMLAPLALYPDPLLAEVLPACAYPQQLNDARAYVQEFGPDGVNEEPWQPAVQAVAHYPDVLNLLDNNLAWTQAVGQAFAYQTADVSASIQRLRMEAYQAGNLQNNNAEMVQLQGSYITIMPVSQEYLYVPQYDPALVYAPYDAAYYGRPAISFGVAFGTGAWLSFGVDWMGGNVFAYPHGYYWGPGGFRNGGPAAMANVSYVHQNFARPQSFVRVNPTTVTGAPNQGRPGGAPPARPQLSQNAPAGRAPQQATVPHFTQAPQQPIRQQQPMRQQTVQVPASPHAGGWTTGASAPTRPPVRTAQPQMRPSAPPSRPTPPAHPHPNQENH